MEIKYVFTSNKIGQSQIDCPIEGELNENDFKCWIRSKIDIKI